MIKRKKSFRKIKLFSKKRWRPRKKNHIKTWIFLFLFLFIFPFIIWSIWFYNNIWVPLPDISEIEDIPFSETSRIVDRNWEILYELYEENRSYVDYDEISINMINALVAIEDRNFWTNPWIDVRWIIRAWVHDIVNLWQDLQWASTLTQQLIKNLLLTNEQTIERKLQEIVLAINLNWYIRQQLKNSYWNLDDETLDKKVKEKIIELYLNYVFLGNNSYWVEAASDTYFSKSAEDLNILESSIIASLPRSPSSINPYNNVIELMWEVVVNDENWELVHLEEDIKEFALEQIQINLDKSSMAFHNSTNSVLNFLRWLLNFKAEYNWEEYNIKYKIWRKDLVLIRMFVDWYINQEEFTKAIIDWANISFVKKDVNIKAPHFVFNVIEYLEKEYSSEILKKGWLTIRTSLDYSLQQKAEASIRENIENINEQWANNASMIYVDTNNWDILSYVWSADYFNEDIDWNVDMIKSIRQPWSTLKPLIYAKAFMENNFTPETPIYDIPMRIGGNRPNNSDWQFMWIMPLSKALAYSRNIPAIKMYFIVGQEKSLKKFFADLWFTSFDDDVTYWYPMALWSWEIKMINLANAYSHLSVNWSPPKINPILEITWNDWSILYRKQIERQKEVISPWASYLIWKILSDINNMPSSWRSNFVFDWIDFALKTWTSNIRTNSWNSLPRDWWLVSYTPNSVWIFWAWNTRWEAMNPWTYWWRVNAPVWKTFFTKLKDEWLIKNSKINPVEIKNVSINEITWKLASSNTLSNLIVNTVAHIKSIPEKDDSSFKSIYVDTLCDWAVSDNTPSSDLKQAYLIEPETIMPSWRDKNDVIQWRKNTWINKYSEIIWAPVFIDEPTQKCPERAIIANEWYISVSIEDLDDLDDLLRKDSIKYFVRSPFEITNVKIFVWGFQVSTQDFSWLRKVTDNRDFSVPRTVRFWRTTLQVKATDSMWYTASDEVVINLTWEN